MNNSNKVGYVNSLALLEVKLSRKKSSNKGNNVCILDFKSERIVQLLLLMELSVLNV